MTTTKTCTIQLECKDPDAFQEVIAALELSDAKSRKYFEFGEYATVEITVSEDMTLTGRLVPKRGR
jgi:hypothetical protein